jgi:hypothetical protein
MCILIGGEAVRVSGTSIFARHCAPGRQVLVYSMRVFARTPTAMILPLPVVSGSGEQALRFIDLSGYAEFFEEMNAACRPVFESLGLGAPLAVSAQLAEPLLKVEEVGDFEASFVPTVADLRRLDPRFQLPPEVWSELPDYSDWGFAVFQLKLEASEAAWQSGREVHPMAFEFPTRSADRLFFPTVHVHDRSFHSTAHFDHSLYCQREDARERFRSLWSELNPGELERAERGRAPQLEPWYRRSLQGAGAELRCASSANTLDPQARLHAMDVVGAYPNRDLWVG